MNTGIRRKVDDLGRVVIPAGIRRSLSIREGDAVEVHVEGDQVILSKPTDQCVFCGEEEGLETFREKALCRGCVAAVGVLDDNMRTTQPPEPAAADPSRREPSTLPPWPVGQPQRGNGGGHPPADRAPAASNRERSSSRPDPSRHERQADDDQGPPASTTAW